MTASLPGGGAVRAAEASDLDNIVALERLSFSDPWSRASFAEAMSQPWVEFRCLTGPEGGLLGYVVASFAADEGEIASIAVAPDARRQGVGRSLLDWVIGEGERRGTVALYLEVRQSNTAARVLYGSRGFLEVGRRRAYYRNPTEDAMVLRRAMDPAGP
jgi:[ribosomal protein S18]-alanine N-acetyltransferase